MRRRRLGAFAVLRLIGLLGAAGLPAAAQAQSNQGLLASWFDVSPRSQALGGAGVALPGDDAFAPLRRYGRYLNLSADNDPASVRYAYGDGTYARLTEVKEAYDPDAVFSRNPNA